MATVDQAARFKIDGAKGIDIIAEALNLTDIVRPDEAVEEMVDGFNQGEQEAADAESKNNLNEIREEGKIKKEVENIKSAGGA